MTDGFLLWIESLYWEIIWWTALFAFPFLILSVTVVQLVEDYYS